MSKHTTGPWYVAPGDARLVSMPGIVKPINCGNAANAHLIAASPELAETVLAFIALTEQEPCAARETALQAHAEKARGVLRKAIAP